VIQVKTCRAGCYLHLDQRLGLYRADSAPVICFYVVVLTTELDFLNLMVGINALNIKWLMLLFLLFMGLSVFNNREQCFSSQQSFN
jgi:hypothetical protein